MQKNLFQKPLINKNDILKDNVYRKYHSRILCRAFSVKNEGVCVRLDVVEGVLREAIREAKMTRGFQHTDYWGEPLK